VLDSSGVTWRSARVAAPSKKKSADFFRGVNEASTRRAARRRRVRAPPPTSSMRIARHARCAESIGTSENAFGFSESPRAASRRAQHHAGCISGPSWKARGDTFARRRTRSGVADFFVVL
jgi:hypothetical protein